MINLGLESKAHSGLYCQWKKKKKKTKKKKKRRKKKKVKLGSLFRSETFHTQIPGIISPKMRLGRRK
jgi:hypothetical protein